MAKKFWIKSAIKHPGALRRTLHIKAGARIPAKKLAAAMRSRNPKTAKRARLAKTLAKFHK